MGTYVTGGSQARGPPIRALFFGVHASFTRRFFAYAHRFFLAFTLSHLSIYLFLSLSLCLSYPSLIHSGAATILHDFFYYVY